MGILDTKDDEDISDAESEVSEYESESELLEQARAMREELKMIGEKISEQRNHPGRTVAIDMDELLEYAAKFNAEAGQWIARYDAKRGAGTDRPAHIYPGVTPTDPAPSPLLSSSSLSARSIGI